MPTTNSAKKMAESKAEVRKKKRKAATQERRSDAPASRTRKSGAKKRPHSSKRRAENPAARRTSQAAPAKKRDAAAAKRRKGTSASRRQSVADHRRAARTRAKASSRKRRGAYRPRVSSGVKALCALSALFAVFAGFLFLKDPANVFKSNAVRSGGTYIPPYIETSPSEPAMEILAPANPQSGAAGDLAQGRPAKDSDGSGSSAQVLPGRPSATEAAATATVSPRRPTPAPTAAPTAAPTPDPTQAPTIAPTPEPTMESIVDAPVESGDGEADRPWRILNGIPQTDQPLGLAQCDPVDDSFFDGTIFIGDSVTQKLQQYVTNERKTGNPTLLGNARFIAIQSLGTHTALANVSEKSLHPTIKGKKMTMEDALATAGAKKVYIMLGMNDVAVSGMDKSVSNMVEFLYRIRKKMPNIEIYVQSATPRLSGSQPTTQQLFDYDLRIYEEILRINDPKIHFVDVAYVMRDESGKLYESYCSDKSGMALHFTNAGCEKWIEFLYTHANA